MLPVRAGAAYTPLERHDRKYVFRRSRASTCPCSLRAARAFEATDHLHSRSFEAREMNIKFATAMLAALAALASGEALAQQYPARPMRFLVGSPPGSGNDLVSRLLGQKLSERLGQPVVVENRPGGAGLLANDALAKSAPDGHTLVLLSGAHPATAALNRALPYDPIRDFGMVGTVVAYPLVISVAPRSPIRSFADLIERARAA